MVQILSRDIMGYFGGLNAVDFSKPNRSDVEEIMEQFIPDFGTDNS
jgi:hypothetical protein